MTGNGFPSFLVHHTAQSVDLCLIFLFLLLSLLFLQLINKGLGGHSEVSSHALGLLGETVRFHATKSSGQEQAHIRTSGVSTAVLAVSIAIPVAVAFSVATPSGAPIIRGPKAIQKGMVHKFLSLQGPVVLVEQRPKVHVCIEPHAHPGDVITEPNQLEGEQVNNRFDCFEARPINLFLKVHQHLAIKIMGLKAEVDVSTGLRKGLGVAGRVPIVRKNGMHMVAETGGKVMFTDGIPTGQMEEVIMGLDLVKPNMAECVQEASAFTKPPR